ncbi:hypothetical protein Tco_1337749 [Tanacetum coccineum]
MWRLRHGEDGGGDVVSVGGDGEVGGVGWRWYKYNTIRTSKALPMLKMTSLSSSLNTCTPAWIFCVFTCSGTIVVCMSWINFPPIHAKCLGEYSFEGTCKESTTILLRQSCSATKWDTMLNCKGFGHYAEECRKPKWVKDYTYHKKKMMMCKQAEQGVPASQSKADWLENTDERL